ncbi:MAG: gluconate 2-dehydrogenase subunit 3 family protein [Cytophagales bacterium]|nr:gluconate 2-dehydrogenase subunit 3 family protein [Cytophagales bacterium]
MNTLIKRRELIRNLTITLGAGICTPTLTSLLQSCSTAPESAFSNKYNLSSIHEKIIPIVAECIIPTTNTPGAIAAKVPAFISMIFKEVYTDIEKIIFIAGLNALSDISYNKYNQPFLTCNSLQHTEILTALEIKERKEWDDDKKQIKDKKFMILIKDLTLAGFFSSKIGATQVLNYVHIPGRYDGCTELTKGQKCWG